MNRFHIAINTHDIAASIADYTQRLGESPTVMVDGEYALWRTTSLNVSVRKDLSLPQGTIRHFGREDKSAEAFDVESDCNGVVWERFSAQQQDEEIKAIWPEAVFS